nr:hypothetical protein [Tanacetum cinerariifolium]
MELYMMNRQHGRMILESVENGPLIWPTIEENAVTRPKKYSELSATEAIQADCDVKATNIILQGLPPEDLHTTNIDQLHAYLEQHEFHANEVRLMHKRNLDSLALVTTYKRTQTSIFGISKNSKRSSHIDCHYSQDDLDVYDSDYDELNTAKVELMAIYLIMVQMLSLSVNDTLAVELERYKEKAKVLDEGQIVELRKKSKRKVWKPTRKVFSNIGYIWRPTGRTFTMVGNTCPLTRITTSTKVPSRNLIALETDTPKLVVTLVYSRKPRKSKSTDPVSKSKVIKSVSANKKEPSKSWGSTVSNVPSSFLDECREQSVYSVSWRYDGVSPICLLSKASKTKSWLWHQRLSNLNFGAIKHLVRHGLVRGLPKLKFKKDHLCSECAMGKSKKKPHKPKSKDTNQEKLYLLHMDLCGPMRVVSVNGKKYILVIVDDYSQFTWILQDEAPDFIIKFLKMIQVRLTTPVRRIKTYNGTEFVNQTLRKYYEQKQWLPHVIPKIVPLYVSHGKTPYELLHDKLPDLSFFHVFGALCYPINDSENLRKLQLKANIVAPELAASTDLPSTPTVDQDTPSPSNSQTTPKSQSPIIYNDVEEDNHELDIAHMNNDPFFAILIPADPSNQSSSTDTIHIIVHPDHQIAKHNGKWTKDHPLENIIGQLAGPVFTRLQLHEQALFCYYDAFLTFVEPKTYKDALTQSCWIEAMQQELNEFECLGIWELVP